AVRALHGVVVPATGVIRSPDGGRVLSLLTDGTDTSSKAKLTQVAALARDNNVLIYPIAIVSKQYDPTALQTLAQQTGGTFYSASSSSALADVYSSITRALRKTWRVEYITSS